MAFTGFIRVLSFVLLLLNLKKTPNLPQFSSFETQFNSYCSHHKEPYEVSVLYALHQHRFTRSSLICCRSSRPRSVIVYLLIISGIETNPGPNNICASECCKCTTSEIKEHQTKNPLACLGCGALFHVSCGKARKALHATGELICITCTDRVDSNSFASISEDSFASCISHFSERPDSPTTCGYLGIHLLSIIDEAANTRPPAPKQHRTNAQFSIRDSVTSEQNNSILIGSANINSLRGKFHDILARLHTYNYAAFALQETNLNNNIPLTEFSVNEYTLFRRD